MLFFYLENNGESKNANDSPRLHQVRNLFCLPRQERFLYSVEIAALIWYNKPKGGDV